MDEQKIALCPVCYMDVEVSSIGRIFKANYYQRTYYFCCSVCLKTFKKYPEDYVKKKRTRQTNQEEVL